MNPLISVVTTYYRPGGIDITLASMRDQSLRKDQFEIVLVDRRYERRHEEVSALAKEYGVSCIHVPEHRHNGKWISLSSAWNTGMAVARGHYIVFLEDYCYAPPGWLEFHLGVQSASQGNRKRYVVGSFIVHNLPEVILKPPFDDPPYDFQFQYERGFRCTEEDAVLRGEVLPEVCAFKEGRFDPSWIEHLGKREQKHQDLRVGHFDQGAILPMNHIYFRNESLRREFAYDINGLDEHLDRARGPVDIDWQARLVPAGAEVYWDPTFPYHAIEPEWIARTMPWGDFHTRVEGRCSYQDALGYNERRKVEAANGDWRARNPFDMRDLADQLSHWRIPGTIINPADYDVSDEVYWDGKVWPEQW